MASNTSTRLIWGKKSDFILLVNDLPQEGARIVAAVHDLLKRGQNTIPNLLKKGNKTPETSWTLAQMIIFFSVWLSFVCSLLFSLIGLVIVLEFIGLIGTLIWVRTPFKLRHSPTSESCFDGDIQPVFSESHVTFVLTWPQYCQRGREGGKMEG